MYITDLVGISVKSEQNQTVSTKSSKSIHQTLVQIQIWQNLEHNGSILRQSAIFSEGQVPAQSCFSEILSGKAFLIS